MNKPRILLSYSKDHFDPDIGKSEHATWGISANILARSFFEALSSIGEVVYIDGYEYESIQGETFDLFIGIERNFSKILKTCNIKKSILIAVNMHPKERNRILLNASRTFASNQAIANGDLVDEKDIMQSIRHCDFIFCLGNNRTVNSYLKHGVSIAKIKAYNYGLIEKTLTSSATNSRSGHRRLLYSASAIGLRKGYDIVESLMPLIKQAGATLDIIGAPTNDYYAAKIAADVKKYKGSVRYHGYIPARSKKYEKIYKQNDFLLFPSLEEGQAGTVVEAMYYGLIPLTTAESGVDFSFGDYLTPFPSAKNTSILRKALALDQPELKSEKNKTLEFYEKHHTGLITSVQEAVGNVFTHNHLYPMISVILPIYNKESSIKSLLSKLHVTLNHYKNAELLIYFDGCTDSTEKIVTKYFKKRRRTYSVAFESTPNIFEVKTNNLGLYRSRGKYAVLLQDDNYIYDKNIFYEATLFLDNAPRTAILGGLAGVNFYPIGTKNRGKGQIISNAYESYWRQDYTTNSKLADRIFEVDACMRGPLIIRKSFTDKYGQLDEVFAPLYQDDMDLCFRTRKYGYNVACMLMDVKNASLTMAHYSSDKARHFASISQKNSLLFYKRWNPEKHKDFLWQHRTKLSSK